MLLDIVPELDDKRLKLIFQEGPMGESHLIHVSIDME